MCLIFIVSYNVSVNGERHILSCVAVTFSQKSSFWMRLLNLGEQACPQSERKKGKYGKGKLAKLIKLNPWINELLFYRFQTTLIWSREQSAVNLNLSVEENKISLFRKPRVLLNTGSIRWVEFFNLISLRNFLTSRNHSEISRIISILVEGNRGVIWPIIELKGCSICCVYQHGRVSYYCCVYWWSSSHRNFHSVTWESFHNGW